jgi:hypothetical protein
MIAKRRSVGIAAALTTALLLLCAFAMFSASSDAAKKKKKVGASVPGLAIGIDDSGLHDAKTAGLSLKRAGDVGASYIRVSVDWFKVAPNTATKPAGFDPRNPGDPNYAWGAVDEQVKRASAAGFMPFITLLNAPKWAQNGTAPSSAYAGAGAWKPSPVEFGNFAHAAAVRYSGTYSDATSGGILPKVSIWQAWNEPNLPLFLAPTSPELYRSLLNSMYDEVKAVQPASTVVTAGLAPVKSSTPAAFPKDFAQTLLCLTPSNGWFDKDPNCPALAKFDVMSLHPYSLRAKPTQRAAVIGNMFVADVVDFGQMLKAASSSGAVNPGAKRIWITEFAWFTNPPNKSVGDKPEVAGKRTSISLYLLWHAGVTQITWFALSDNSGAIIKGGGLWDADGKPKPTYYALRFPFFVRQSGHKLLIWGRSPYASSRKVSIKVKQGDGYELVTKIKPSPGGVFQARITIDSKKSTTYFAQQGTTLSPSMNSREYFNN